jgi:hypothetical protein
MFHADIKSKAATDTGLPVYAGRISPRATLPAIAYVTNFDTREPTMQDASGTTKKIVTFYIMAGTYDALESAANNLQTGFSGFGGTMGGTHVLKGAKLIADETSAEMLELDGAPVYLRTMSFSLTHR